MEATKISTHTHARQKRKTQSFQEQSTETTIDLRKFKNLQSLICNSETWAVSIMSELFIGSSKRLNDTEIKVKKF